MSIPSFPGNIFIVVDPAQEQPLALERATITAKLFDGDPSIPSPKMHVFLSVDADNTDTSADNPSVHRDGRWFFERIINPLQEAEMEYTVEMSWSTDWYGSIIKESEKQDARLIMLPMARKPSAAGRILKESIWKLMRTAPCPVLVVQPGAAAQRKVVLMAVNFQAHKPEYDRLNEVIISRGQWMAKTYGAELHVVNAYADSLNYPDRGELAAKTGVDTDKIHVVAGAPEDVIAETADEIGADILVIGTQARSGRWRGNTAEKIITRVDCDVLTIN